MQARRFRQHRNIYDAAVLLTPFVILYAAFLVYPFCKGLWMSFHDWPLLEPAGTEPVFLGLGNYGELVTDTVFWTSLLHTLEFTLLAVPLITITGLVLALGLRHTRRGSAAMRAVFFTSGVFSVTVVTLIWLIVFNPVRGLLGQAFFAMGLTPVDVLADRRFAMPALVVTTLWWSVGLPMALFLAGLQHIPPALYEAAELDHASSWTMFRRITWPGLTRTTWLVVFIEVVMHFQVFGQVLLMTRGGPANSTRVLVQHIYESSFRDWRVGYASAAAMVLFTVLLGVSLVQFRILRQDD
ncbi:carbohydrate ABC transporter permease [Nitrospira sp. Nam74]